MGGIGGDKSWTFLAALQEVLLIRCFLTAQTPSQELIREKQIIHVSNVLKIMKIWKLLGPQSTYIIVKSNKIEEYRANAWPNLCLQPCGLCKDLQKNKYIKQTNLSTHASPCIWFSVLKSLTFTCTFYATLFSSLQIFKVFAPSAVFLSCKKI